MERYCTELPVDSDGFEKNERRKAGSSGGPGPPFAYVADQRFTVSRQGTDAQPRQTTAAPDATIDLDRRSIM
ncbi:hypothetical protein [Streptosporangium sp. NPDC002721]|uniref:hypothetical protein n=1 Tax=Streptosporangium sp. NPDC002721 TaxID=3366188 RepID=UPI003691D9C6